MSTCYLLKIPPELGLHIFEYALLEPNGTAVHWSLVQPPLLRTCRQVRTEALSTWYNESICENPTRDCDATLLIGWDRHLKTKYTSRGKGYCVMRLEGDVVWQNMIRWCRWHLGIDTIHALRPDLTFDAGPKQAFVIAASYLLTNAARTGQTWDECLPNLEALRFALKAFKPTWLK